MTVTEVAPSVWRWTAPHPEWRNEKYPWTHEVASFALTGGPDGLVLVDPLVPAAEDAVEPVLQGLDRLAADTGAVSIFVTVPYHVRSAEELHERYAASHRVSLLGHPAAAKRLRRPGLLTDVTAGPLPGAARAVRIGNPVRQETPVYFPSHRALAFGDALVGVDGELRVWDVIADPKRARWYEERFLPSLRPLLELDVELVLVTHGPPILRDGRARLAHALAAPPWHYRS